MIKLVAHTKKRGNMVLRIITLIVIGAGFVFWFLNINPFIGYLIGLTLGMSLIVLLFRKLGKSSQKSLIASELFSKMSSCKLSYTISTKMVEPNTNHNDFKEIMTVLKGQMGFPASEAKEATNFAISEMPDAPLEIKISEALNFLDNRYK